MTKPSSMHLVLHLPDTAVGSGGVAAEATTGTAVTAAQASAVQASRRRRMRAMNILRDQGAPPAGCGSVSPENMPVFHPAARIDREPVDHPAQPRTYGQKAAPAAPRAMAEPRRRHRAGHRHTEQ